MNILYIATSFPTPDKGSTIYTDLAEAISQAGHNITVAVSEQPKNLKKTLVTNERGFEVLRVVTGNYYDVGLIEKGITTLKIPVKMRKGILKYLKDRNFDFILFEAPPVTNAGLISKIKKEFRCPAYLMLKDIFPQNAADLGIMKKNGIIYKYFEVMEKRLFKTADIIGCMSAANKKYLSDHNPDLDPEKIEIFPNTKKLSSLTGTKGYPLREKYNIPLNSTVFLFGGNMGRPQYIDLFCRAVIELKNDKNIFLLFVGRGTDRYKLEDIIKQNDIMNALVIGNLPRDEYEQIIKECDIGLITLDPRFTIPNFPSRILSYMEYAKPVLAATDNVSDLKDMIKDSRCGDWVWSGDSGAFIRKIKEMSNSDQLEIMGLNGRKYIEDNFDVKVSVGILEKFFVKYITLKKVD